MSGPINIGNAKVAVDLLKEGKMNVFDASDVMIRQNGWVDFLDENGVNQYYPPNRVGSIQEK